VFIVGDGKLDELKKYHLLTSFSMSHTQPESWPRDERLHE